MSIEDIDRYKNASLKGKGVWSPHAANNIRYAMNSRRPDRFDLEKSEEYGRLIEIACEYLCETEDEKGLTAIMMQLEDDKSDFLSALQAPKADINIFRAIESIVSECTRKMRNTWEYVTGKCSWCNGEGWPYEDYAAKIRSCCMRCSGSGTVKTK